MFLRVDGVFEEFSNQGTRPFQRDSLLVRLLGSHCVKG